MAQTIWNILSVTNFLKETIVTRKDQIMHEIQGIKIKLINRIKDILSVFNVFMIGHVRYFISVLPRLVI